MSADTVTPEQRRNAERERIQSACRQLLTSEGWTRWVRARSLFHSYSLTNQLLIALQAPDATYVAGFHTWRRLGRHVRKGELSIRISAPLRLRRDEPSGDETVVTAFRSVGVFDLTQTDPIPGVDQLPLQPPSQPTGGDSHAHLIPALLEHATSLGYVVLIEPTSGCHGYCNRHAKTIGISDTLPSNAQLRVLIHELCHAHGAGYDAYPRATSEVIVDTATHIVCAGLGLDVASDAIPYISGWGENDDALSAITSFATIIHHLAATLEEAATGFSRTREG
jgi:hypothetical protein